MLTSLAVVLAAGGVAAQPPELIEVDAASVLGVVREAAAPASVVNVWATWCMPCREEFPDLVRLHREYRERGVRLILVSADFPSETEDALAFLAAHGVDFPSYLKIGDDMEFIDGLDERWSGALPATFIYDAAGNLRHFWEGKASYDQLERSVLEVLRGLGAAE